MLNCCKYKTCFRHTWAHYLCFSAVRPNEAAVPVAHISAHLGEECKNIFTALQEQQHKWGTLLFRRTGNLWMKSEVKTGLTQVNRYIGPDEGTSTTLGFFHKWPVGLMCLCCTWLSCKGEKAEWGGPGWSATHTPREVVTGEMDDQMSQSNKFPFGIKKKSIF